MTNKQVEKRQPKAFMVADVSQNANSFGLYGHILVARDGEAYESARSRGKWHEEYNKGSIVTLQPLGDGWNWAAAGFEIPRTLDPAPPAVAEEMWTAKWVLKGA